MADQGKWFKLWESALDDQELENLDLDTWARWARLGTYLKKHGKDGKITIKSPAVALQNLLRLKTFDEVKDTIKLLPGYAFEESQSVTPNVTIAPVTLNIKCSNWNKYQGDFSGDRVRKFRQRVTPNVTAQEEKRRDVEEKRKRREESPLKPPAPKPMANETAPYEVPLPETDPLKALIVAYKVLKGFRFDDRSWDRDNWSRSAKAVKAIYETFGMNFRITLRFIESKAAYFKKQDKTDWRVDWIVGDAHDWKLKLGGSHDDEARNREGLSRAVSERRESEKHSKGGSFASANEVLGGLRNPVHAKTSDEPEIKT